MFTKFKEWLTYDPDTGIFTWKHGRYTHVKGKLAGNIQPNGYRYIQIEGNAYRACRLAWFFYYGEEPQVMIDHINRIRYDDRIANLRLANRAHNLANNTKGIRGVYRHGNKWKAQLTRNKYLGLFTTKEGAFEAVKAEHIKVYGEFTSCE